MYLQTACSRNKIQSKAPDLMGCKTNNGGVRHNGDEDLGPEKLISSRYLKWLSKTSQTSGQSVEDLIEDHLSCAVILQKQ